MSSCCRWRGISATCCGSRDSTGRLWRRFLLLVGLACVIVPVVFRRAGVYSRYWRYASVDEMLLLAGSVTVAVLLTGAISLAAVQLLPDKPPLPRSIPLIFLLLALVATAGPRFAVRLSARARRS